MGANVSFLSDEWLALLAEEAAALPEMPGITASLEITLRNPDDSTRVFVFRFADGRLGTTSVGAFPAADMHVEAPLDAYTSLSTGDPGPLERAALNGLLRTTGDIDKATAIGGVVFSEAFSGVLARVHERTLY